MPVVGCPRVQEEGQTLPERSEGQTKENGAAHDALAAARWIVEIAREGK